MLRERKKKRGRGGKSRKSSTRLRIKIALFLFFLSFGVYVFRAGQLSLFSPELKERVMRQSRTKISIKGKRGRILARDGEILAKDIPSYSIWINPILVRKRGKEKAVILIARKLGISKKEVRKKLKKELYFVWLKRKLSEEKFKKVVSLAKRYGLRKNEFGYIKEWKRFYPYGKITAHITGFVNVDSRGLAGLELEFDDNLKGGSKRVAVLRDALGRIIMRFLPEPPLPGNDIITTIDIDLQVMLFRKIREKMRELKAKGAFAIAMTPEGEILAAVSLPSYDPNNYSKYAGKTSMLARFYQTIFEPGSIFKVFTLAVALEENVVSTEDTFYCYEGEWKFEGKVINDVEKIGYANLREILAHSSNICAAQISLLIGKEKFYKYLVKLGFGKKTGIELPGEEEGILHKPSKWKKIDLASLGFGHFIGTTGVQIIRAFSVFVREGYLVKPFLVKKMVSPSGEVIFENKPVIQDRIFSSLVVELMREMMRDVVISGTGKKAEIEHYPVAGKTGTSRKVERGRYVSKYWSSFIGFSPYHDPKIILLVVFDEPKKKFYGGDVAAPVFAKVVEKYFASRFLKPQISYKETELNTKRKLIPKKDEWNKKSGGYLISQKLEGSRDYDVGNYGTDNKKADELKRATLKDILERIPEDKRKKKKIVIKGYGFFKDMKEERNKIIIFLSPK